MYGKKNIRCIFVAVFMFQLVSLSFCSCCVEFNELKCVKCPSKMHLYRDNCINDI